MFRGKEDTLEIMARHKIPYNKYYFMCIVSFYYHSNNVITIKKI